ncbi:FG-GAP-like repeat-containing protein [Streptomyces sp. NPDC048420]|uniref:DNRLRE domain-containing protein n=1 Tax=Streptomyces sp. NPDC048420 TaxID=3155755 RepID=UPI003446CEC5
MTRNWGRMPGRRATAALLAATVTTSGIVYAGLRLSDEATREGGDGTRRASLVTEAAALTEATRTGRNVEVTAARTARSTTWARPDGLMTKRLYASPIRAKVGGGWKKIDTSLRRTEQGWEPRATNTRMLFSAGSADRSEQRASRSTVQRVSLVKSAAADTGTPLATLYVGENDDYQIQLTWPGAVPTPIVDGDRILYPEIFPGGDLVLTADDDGFGQLLVVKTRAAAADPHVQQLVYGLNSANLSFRLDPLSGMVTAVNGYRDEVAVSPTPLMWDSSGTPAVTDGGVGATAQPTVSESPNPTDSPSVSDSPDAAEEEAVESDEQSDTDVETLPPASDGPAPTVSESPLASAPAEPAPAPSQTGSAATLSLPSLNGPSPDSRGDVVKADLSAGQWTLTPDQDFLSDPATTYPVFIDPSVKKHTQNWTTAYNRFPKATFYNGKGFNKGGTHEARVGFESDTWGTSRSFFNIQFDKDLKGTRITSAKLRMLETYSWSCQARSMSVHLTGRIDAHTNWNNAPELHDGNKLATKSFAHGYKSGCRDAFEAFDVRAGAQKTADKGAAMITFGLRARDENAQYAWKKFQADQDFAPYVELEYNRKPSIVSDSLDLGPDGRCTTTKPYVRMGSGDLTFTAKATDKDKNLDYLDFDLWEMRKWETTGDLLKSTGKVSAGADTGTALRTTDRFSTSGLKSGATYSWRVRAFDDVASSSPYYPAKTPCRFVLDTTAPRPPKVTSTDFPNADGSENGFGSGTEDSKWSDKKFGTAGAFYVRAVDTDVVRYEYGFNSPTYTGSLPRVNGSPTSLFTPIGNAKPPAAGPNVLYVRTVDAAGNVSEPTKYFFYVTPRDQADKAGDFTGDQLPDMLVVTEGGNLGMYPSQALATDLAKGTGDLDYSMPGAYRANPAKDPNGDDLPPYVAAVNGHFKGALITHNGDIYGGDGLQDLVVRVEGRLWVYPGDGYGAVNTDRRQEILLPTGAPSPSALTQIVATGDITGDGRTDFLATVGDALWALTGYHGATVDQAVLLSGSAWTSRDLVTVMDVSGDGIADMVYRTDASGRLLLRKGVAASGGGTNLNSLASAANSSGGTDTEYGASGWLSSEVPLLMGTPDANSDGIPDIWAVNANGSVRFHPGSRTVLSGTGAEIIAPASYWKTRIAIG